MSPVLYGAAVAQEGLRDGVLPALYELELIRSRESIDVPYPHLRYRLRS